MHLHGTPELPFVQRFNLTVMQSRVMDLLGVMALFTAPFAFLRQPPDAQDRAAVGGWLAVAAAMVAVDLVWRVAARRSRDGGSHVRWREMLATAYLLWMLTWGAPALWSRNFTNLLGDDGSGRGRVAAHFLLLVLCSHAHIPSSSWGASMRLSLALPVHLVCLAGLLRHNHVACSGAALAAPSGQQLTRRLFEWVGVLQLVLQPMLSVEPTSASPDRQCAALLTFFQLSLGMLIPASLAASLQARLFQQHQRERRQHGLPPETGWQARLYG